MTKLRSSRVTHAPVLLLYRKKCNVNGFAGDKRLLAQIDIRLGKASSQNLARIHVGLSTSVHVVMHTCAVALA